MFPSPRSDPRARNSRGTLVECPAHNNQHTFPFAAYIGARCGEIDIASFCIKVLERYGLVWHVGRITPQLLQRKNRLHPD